MNDCERIVLTKKEFGDDLFFQIGLLSETLLTAGYVFVVREEEKGIVVIDFNYDTYKGHGNCVPIWVDPDTAALIEEMGEDEIEQLTLETVE